VPDLHIDSIKVKTRDSAEGTNAENFSRSIITIGE
jgi:hypothetical protein